VLQKPITRILLVALAIPIAVVINGVRVFLTGFLVYFVDPALGKGFMHITEGWLLFLVSLASMGVVAWLGSIAEGRFTRKPAPTQGHVADDVVEEEVASEDDDDDAEDDAAEDCASEGVDRG
jgi:exosortase/archaeosortase family protein